MEEGKIPPRIWDRIAFTPSSRKSLGSAFIQQHKIPTGVNEILATHNLQDLYATSRIRPFTGTIKCVKLPFDKNVTRLATNVRRLIGSTLASDRDGLWFRGIGLDALESTLAFFIPERNSRNVDNEFGPGFTQLTTWSMPWNTLEAGVPSWSLKILIHLQLSFGSQIFRIGIRLCAGGSDFRSLLRTSLSHLRILPLTSSRAQYRPTGILGAADLLCRGMTSSLLLSVIKAAKLYPIPFILLSLLNGDSGELCFQDQKVFIRL